MAIDHRHHAPRRAVVSENVMTVTAAIGAMQTHSGDELSVFKMSSAQEPDEDVSALRGNILAPQKETAHAKPEAPSAHVQPPSPNPLLESDCSVWFSDTTRASHLMPHHKSTTFTIHHTCS